MSGLTTYAQDSTSKYTLDSSFFNTLTLGSYLTRFNYISHSPNKKDYQLYKKHKNLIGQEPTLKNHRSFYLLACSLWELEKMDEAEKMFLQIINSKEKYYSSTFYHSSDIPGDTTTNTYGYGSYTSNYKNYAAIYLTKIYIEQKKYDQALQYLEDAVKKYKVGFNCGTGHYMQQEQYNALYLSCYEGLQRYKDIVDLLLPSCLYMKDEILITSIKKLYSPQQIKEYLEKAESSIQFSADSLPTLSYQITYDDYKKQKIDSFQYFSGSATILLFDSLIDMPVPRLENGDRLTKEYFIKLFKESYYYTRLKDETTSPQSNLAINP